MKVFFTLFILCALSVCTLQAQTAINGDYRSVATGTWSTAASWEVRAGGTWSVAASAPTATNNVYIQSGHTITADGAVSCNDLHVHTDAFLSIGANSVSVNGKIRAWVAGGKATTNQASDGTTATITISAGHVFTAGQSVKITGLTANASTFNKTATLIAASTPTFTYAPGNATVVTSAAITAGIAYLVSAQVPVTGSADGTFYTAQTAARDAIGNSTITTSTGGVLKFVGNTRPITATGDWTALGLSPCDMEFALTAGQIGTIGTAIKANNFTFSSGTTSVSSGSRLMAEASSNSGTVTIKSGATLISANSGASGASQVISGNGVRCGTVTIETNAILELTGNITSMSTTNFVNNGTVVYSGGAQSMLQVGNYSGSNALTSYKNLTLSGSGNKSLINSITVDALTLSGTTSIPVSNGVGSTITYNSGGTLIFAATGAISIGDTSRVWPAASGPTNLTINSNTFGFLTPTSPVVSRTLSGTFTMNGGTFNVNSGNTLIFANGSTIDRLATAGAFNAGSGTITYGTTSAGIITVNIGSGSAGATMTSSSETYFASVAKMNLNIFSGYTYILNSNNKVVTDLALNGTLSDDGTAGRLITVKGKITGTGTHTSTGAGTNTITMIGNTVSSDISGATFKNLTLNDADGFALTGAPTVTGTLTLTAGKLSLGNFNITPTTLSGGSSSAYIATTGAGSLIHAVAAATAQTYHVGASTSSYDPIAVTPTSATTFTVNVKSGFTNSVDATKSVAKEFNIASSAPSSTAITITPSNGSGLTETTSTVGHYTGSAWEELAATRTGSTWSFTTTSFSPFGAGNVGGFAAVLPIELINFQAKRNEKSTLLTWTTATEKDNATFHIEQSTNGTNFQTIGQVKGSGTTTTATNYNFEHKDPSVGVNYYRLKQVDFNGTATYSAVQSVVFGKGGLAIKTTLVHDALDIVVSDDATTPLSIFNISGQQVWIGKAQGTQRLDVGSLPNGLYIVRTATGDVGRFVKQ